MIIQKIQEIKQAGVWKNFSAPDDLQLARYNLIYGFNGSGKTTLSRVLASIERKTLEDGLPKETTFKIQASDGTIVTHNSSNNPFENNLLVFNTDFVSRNFQWGTGNTQGLVYLSEKKVDARKEYDGITPKLKIAKEKIKTQQKAKDVASKAFSDFKTRVARNIRELASSSSYTQSYDARKIQTHYATVSFTQDKVLSEDKLKAFQELLTQREPLPRLSFSSNLPKGLTKWFSTGLSLLSQNISNIALNEFEAFSDALRWVEDGLHYHNKNNVSDCLLCGNPFTKARRAHLQKLFDRSWIEALNALKSAVDAGQKHQQELRDFYGSIPRLTEIATEEREAFTKNRILMEEAIKKIGICVGELLTNLQEKIENPTKEILVDGNLADFNLTNWMAEYEKTQAALETSLQEHNNIFQSFAAMQKNAFEKIEMHVLATNQDEWDQLQKTIKEVERELTTATNDETALTNRQLELLNDLQDHGVGADKMNDLIWTYLGHKELRLVAVNDGYVINRSNGVPATELSEGERMAISFCYFLTQLAAEGRNVENLILVIDDPISSLDTAARSHALSLMTRMTKKCAQVIVLTHNTSFMNMVKREYQNLQRREEKKTIRAFLYLDCRSSGDDNNRTTSLSHMHDLLVKYDSEYHYLFSLVSKAAENKTSEYVFLLPNATRKLLEIFTTFCSPDQSSFAGALMDHQNTVKDKLDVKALERLIQIESHGTIEGLATPPDLTLEEAIRAAEAGIIFIKEVGKDHYKKMKRVCAQL